MEFFAGPYSKAEILGKLKEYTVEDMDPYSDRAFTIAFETGLDDLKEIIHRALTTFADKNVLDFLEFPSAIKMENFNSRRNSHHISRLLGQKRLDVLVRPKPHGENK